MKNKRGKREKERLRGRKGDLCHKTKKPWKLQKDKHWLFGCWFESKEEDKKMHILSNSSSPSIIKSNHVFGCILIFFAQNLIDDPNAIETTLFQIWIWFHFRSKKGGVHHLRNLGTIIKTELALFWLCFSRVSDFWV